MDVFCFVTACLPALLQPAKDDVFLDGYFCIFDSFFIFFFVTLGQVVWAGCALCLL